MRDFHFFRFSVNWYFFLLGTMLYSIALNAENPQDIQNIDSITAAVRNFLGTLQNPEKPTSVITVDRLDPRLRLSACEVPLEVTLATGARPSGRTVVSVHCPSPRPWSLYVPAKIAIPIFVVVANRPILKDQPVSAADIAVEQRDASELPAGYLTDPNQILGKVLSRPVTAGSILIPGQARAPRVIRRGDRVSLIISGSGLTVRSTGTALADAGLGERVTVRNENSRRIVEGTAQENGVVVVDW